MANNILLKEIPKYLSADKNLTPLKGKIPKLSDWTNRTVDKDVLLQHDGNIGWVLGVNDLVIDVDPRNGGQDSYNNLVRDLKLDLTPTVNTPSGGFHIYMDLPNNMLNVRFRKTLQKYPGIDFLTKGSQCVIVGCITDKGKYTWSDDQKSFSQAEVPKNVISLISQDDCYSSANDRFTDIENSTDQSSYISAEQVQDMLKNIDPSMTHNDWIKVGMSLHSWHNIDGLPLWEEWSKNGENYDEGETEKRWKSFNINGKITMGTLHHMVKDAKWEKEEQKINDYIRKIDGSNLKMLEFHIFKEINNDTLDKIQLERLVKSIQSRYKELTEVRLSVSNIRKKITNTEIVSGYFISDDDNKPDWCQGWCYVNSHACFVNLKTLEKHKAESFNIINGKYVPASEGGSKPPAVKYAADRGYIEDAHHIAYLPTYDNVVCEIEGLRVVNSFSHNSIPMAAKAYTEGGLKAIERIKKHIKFIFGNDENADIFIHWIAHQIQYPGKKIPWAPVIQSIQGAGKSFFGELLRSCLGDRNVGTVSPTQVTSDFNGWATNCCVNILEELRVKGHNRHEAVNALKPLITDRMIQINDKGVKQFMTYNTTNYICFTNYADAIPMDADDRRWWVSFVQMSSIDEMPDLVGESADIYFHKLFSSVGNYTPEISKWLQEHKITDRFLAIKQAPMTSCKQRMIATEEHNLEGLDEVRNLIKEGGKYFNNSVISSVDLFETLSTNHPEVNIQSTREKNMLLKKLGYMLHPKSIKINGSVKKVWTKKSLTNTEIRMYLQEGESQCSDENWLNDL